MVGHPRISLPTVYLVNLTVLNMLSAVQMEHSLPYIRDLTADLLSEVTHDVSTEPSPQSLTVESLSLDPYCELWCWCSPRYQGIWLLGLSVSMYFFSMFKYLTPLTVPTPTANMRIWSIVSTKREFERLNTGSLTRSFSPLQVAWVPLLL